MKKNFSMIRHQNFNYSTQINKFVDYEYFRCDCTIHYRLCITVPFNTYWAVNKINDFYFINNKFCITENINNVVDYFSEVISQSSINDIDDIQSKLSDIISNNGYIMGLFDTYYFPGNTYYKKEHIFNTFLIYGYDQGYYHLYANHGLHGGGKTTLSEKELLEIIYLTRNSYNNVTIHGGDLLYKLFVKPLDCYNSPHLLYNNMISFYSRTTLNTNCGVFNEMFNNISNCICQSNPKCNCDFLFSIKLIIDCFKLMNDRITIVGASEIIVKNNCMIIDELNILFKLYIKYQYSPDHKIINRIEMIIKRINQLVDNNYRIALQGV